MGSSLNLVRWAAFRDLLDSEADYTASNLDSLRFVHFQLDRVVLKDKSSKFAQVVF